MTLKKRPLNIDRRSDPSLDTESKENANTVLVCCIILVDYCLSNLVDFSLALIFILSKVLPFSIQDTTTAPNWILSIFR
jgi:hypothetical protein